jgi:hypothetical protein
MPINMAPLLQMEQQFNFIEGAKYNQIDLQGEQKDRPLD